MRSAAGVLAGGPPPSGCAESSTAPRGAPRSSVRLGSGCSSTSDSPPPSARPSAGSQGGPCAGQVAERTSISAQSAGDATAAACPASQSWRSPEGPRGRRGRTGGQPAAIVVIQAHPSGPKLARQEPVFFDQVGDRLPLPAIQPAGQHAQHHLQRRGVDHEVELISSARLTDVGPSRGTLRLNPGTVQIDGNDRALELSRRFRPQSVSSFLAIGLSAGVNRRWKPRRSSARSCHRQW